MRHTPCFYRHQRYLASADLGSVPPRESWRSDSLYEGKCNDVPVAGAGPLPASELNGSARMRRRLEDEGNRVRSLRNFEDGSLCSWSGSTGIRGDFASELEAED